MAKSNRKRRIRISVRFDEQEYAAFKQKCASAGLCMEETIRQLVVRGEIRQRPEDRYRKLLSELGAIGNNLNQLASVANRTGRAEMEAIRQATALMKEVSILVREAI